MAASPVVAQLGHLNFCVIALFGPSYNSGQGLYAWSVIARPRAPSSSDISAEILKTEVNLAFTLLTCARISSIEQNIMRYRRTARAAYETVSRLIQIARIDPPEREQIASRLESLKEQLELTGEPVGRG